MYPTTEEALTAFLDHYELESPQSLSIDDRLEAKVSDQNYLDILKLSIRQTFGGCELTIPLSYLSNLEDNMAFAKEFSSDGNINPTFPILYVMDPE